MKVIYLAHKIRDPRGRWYVQQHIRAAEGIALALWQMGHAVICPGKNTEWFDGAADDDLWLRGDLAILKRCDAVVMCPGWQTSIGATTEHDRAIRLGIPVHEWRDVLMGQVDLSNLPETL